MLCSLCKSDKECNPLDTEDAIFRIYLKIFQKKERKIGICSDCREKYEKMRKEHEKKITIYGIGGFVAAILYFYFSGNVVFAILMGAFISSFSIISYCPPLKS